MKIRFFCWLFLFTAPAFLFAQNFPEKLRSKEIFPEVYYYEIYTDTLFNSSQDIHILEIDNGEGRYEFDLAYRKDSLIKTSVLVLEKNAVAAINGGFFDVKRGGSVNYLEYKDSVINPTRKEGEAGAISKMTMNGAIVQLKSGEVLIEERKSDEFYASSSEEDFVLVTGPILLIKGTQWDLPDTQFSNNRHPRSCLCINDEKYFLIAIDGRSESGSGMSLPELQKFLSRIGCKEAINLDGGGSTTLWTNSDKMNLPLNHPSDKTGERPIANALLIKKR